MISITRGMLMQLQSLIMVGSDSRTSQVDSTVTASTLLGDSLPDRTIQLGLRHPGKGEVWHYVRMSLPLPFLPHN